MKQALISVYYKEGIDRIARQLTDHGWKIISSGGTASFLRENQIPVTEISEITKFPEILDGRVKTLHPLIFGSILAKNNNDHLQQMHTHGIDRIDLVIVNFYPFENALLNRSKGDDFMIENIDIGGPSMVRAAAKNYKNTIVVVDQADYEPVVQKLTASDNELSPEEKRQLAAKAFSYTCFYDSLISGYFQSLSIEFPKYLSVCGRQTQSLRYGENPHQKGAMYIQDQNSPLNTFTQLQGKELSFNNILDLSMVYEVISDFAGQDPFCVIVKHQNPCGAGSADSQTEAFQKALSADPKSAFGGIVGFNRPLDVATAKEIKNIFFEVIVAPDFSEDALAMLAKKTNLRLIKMPLGYSDEIEIKKIPGGFICQDKDKIITPFENFTLKTSRALSSEDIQNAEFGWKLIKYVKSNAIILVKNRQLIGVGAGQMSRVDAVEIAIKKCQFPTENAILVSDAFFPFADSVDIAAAHHIRVLVEPGGSVRDSEVIDAAEKHGISLLFTGVRHFRH
jgi:phosphoribosylaminoimidazolecarboxamide formyltransferase/IMP cyclohydrolase